MAGLCAQGPVWPNGVMETTVSVGLDARSSRRPRPSAASVPGSADSTRRSAEAARSRIAARPAVRGDVGHHAALPGMQERRERGVVPGRHRASDDAAPPQGVTARGLHLQYLGASVDPELGAVATGQRGREVQHTEAFQRTRHSTPLGVASSYDYVNRSAEEGNMTMAAEGGAAEGGAAEGGKVELDTTDVDRWLGVPLQRLQPRYPITESDIGRWAQGMQNPNPLYLRPRVRGGEQVRGHRGAAVVHRRRRGWARGDTGRPGPRAGEPHALRRGRVVVLRSSHPAR